MEKISRIIPASPRVKGVDMSRERPVRESAPGFGAPVSSSTNRGPKKFAVVEATKVYNETYGADAKMAREADQVRKLAEEFFVNQAEMPNAAFVVHDAPTETLEESQPVTVPQERFEIPSDYQQSEPEAPQAPSFSKRV